MRKWLFIAGAALLMPVGCREADGPLGGSEGQLIVQSDPQGGHIYVDDTDTGLITPGTVHGIGGNHDISIILDSLGFLYAFGARVSIQGSEVFSLTGPLTAGCPPGSGGACYARNRQPATAGNLQVSINAVGALLLEDGNSDGLLWPVGTLDSYVSNGMPIIAAHAEGRSVALGMYDIPTLAGRPAPLISIINGQLRSDQRTWIVPTTSSRTLTTIRGIEVREQILIDPAVPDVALIRLTYRNITNSPNYQRLDIRGTALGTDGITYDDVYAGFALDSDVGGAQDDLMSYDPALNAVFAYDADFKEARFAGASSDMAGLIGVRLLSSPQGGHVVLNGYGSQAGAPNLDWHAGTADERIGWGVLSGTAAFSPDDPDPNIGMLVPESDVRIMVTAGPYTLRPSDEVTIVVAVALARPVPGTFTAGTVVAPGNPHDPSRQIMTIAAALRDKLTMAATLLSKVGN